LKECVVDLRGLELRARHAVISNPSLRHRKTARLVGLEPVSSWTLESRRETEFCGQRQSGANRRLAVKDGTRD
jgi:hypothetical protein